MSYTAERTRNLLLILHTADKVGRRVQTNPMLALMLELERDIYAETIAATGIDPQRLPA